MNYPATDNLVSSGGYPNTKGKYGRNGDHSSPELLRIETGGVELGFTCEEVKIHTTLIPSTARQNIFSFSPQKFGFIKNFPYRL